jgi:branched-chain amino acid transport system substrate-binding protein
MSALVAACGGSSAGSSNGAAKDPLKVLYVAGITGLLAPSAKGVERGMKAAIADINSRGGVNGRMIESVTKDNQSDATRGLTLVQQEINGSDLPDMIIPGISSNEALALAPLLSREKRVGMGASSSGALNDPVKFPYYFSQVAMQTDILAAIAEHIQKAGGKSVAVVIPNDGLGEAISKGLGKEFNERGIKTKESRFAPDGVDYTASFAEALASKPDFIYTDGSGAQVPHVLDSRIKAKAETIPTIVGVAMGSQPLLELTKGTRGMENINLVLAPGAIWKEPASQSPEFKRFYEGITKQGPLEVPVTTYGSGWEIIKLFAEGVKNIKGNFSQEALKASLESLPASASEDRVMYSHLWTAKSHQIDAQPEELTISGVKEFRDFQFVI